MLPWSIQQFGEDRRGMCKFREWCERRDFPGNSNNICCLTSIKFLKQSVQQSNQIMTEKK